MFYHNVKIEYFSSFFFLFVTVQKSLPVQIRESVFWPKDQKNGRISEKFKLSELELSSIKDKGFLKQTGGT